MDATEVQVPSKPMSGWLVPREAQALLGCGRTTLRYYRFAKRVRTRRDGRTGWYLFNAADVQALAAERGEQATTGAH